MYGIDDLETFVQVAKAQGITPAAKTLGISPATTSHRITKLEKALNFSLFYRNSRNFALTEEGQVFLERVEVILEQLQQAEIEASGRPQSIRGHLRVTLSPWILDRFIMPSLSEFRARHPDLTIEFLTDDHFVPLVEAKVDCAIRIGNLADSSLIAARVCDNDRLICASPDLLERVGVPVSISDLEKAPWACLPWQTKHGFRNESGQVFQLTFERNVLVSSSDMLTSAAVNGLGFAIKSRLAIEQELAEGKLIEVLPGTLSPSDAPIWFVTTQVGRVGCKITAFKEFVLRSFQQSLSK